MNRPSSPNEDNQSASSALSSEPILLLLTSAVLLASVTVVSVPTVPPPAADNPLPECPVPTNCERASRPYAVPPSTLFAATQRALATLGPTALRPVPDSLRAAAVYRVGLIFKDDVTVAVTSRKDASTLHVRSASRVGLYDFEVNRRRVHTLLDAVDRALPFSADQ